jgi:hypothetical protein
MDKLKILYAVAIGAGLGALSFAVTLNLFTIVQRIRRRRQTLAAIAV